MMKSYDGNPQEFVQENREVLIRLLKHGDDVFVRALALAAIIEFGTDPDLEDVKREIVQAGENNERGLR